MTPTASAAVCGPMRAYSSTILGMLDKYCPRALDFAEAGQFRDREFFQAGIAAHAILQAIGEAPESTDPRETAEAVVRTLVTEGRSFHGHPEPPMSPEQATTGRDIALRYLAMHAMPVAGKYEMGLAVDKDWQPVPYRSKDAYYRAAIDVVQVSEDVSDDGYPICTVATTDWKSAWPTSADELETIQLRGQAALAWAHNPSATVLIRRAVNLRTGASYEAETVMDEDGSRIVAGWRADIGHAIAAAEARGADGKRPARPGSGCMGCPYLMACPDSLPMRGDRDPISLAKEWMLLEAWRAGILPKLKELAAETAIDTGAGMVGYGPKTKREATTDAPRAIAAGWFQGEATETEVGLLTAVKLGASNVDAAAKVLYPYDKADPAWKENRAALLAACLRDVTTIEFGVINGE